MSSGSLAHGSDGGDAAVFPLSVEEAERDAERIAAFARAAAGLIITVALVLALAFVPEDERDRVEPRLYVAFAIMAGFVVLAILSFLTSRARRYRPPLAYVFAAADAALVLFALQEGLLLANHHGALVFAQPPIWLVPIAIAIQAVRFRAGPLVFSTVLFMFVLSGLIVYGGTGWNLDGPSDSVAALFDEPPDVVRILMLVIAAMVLAISVRSKRDILLRGLQTARREAELKRFLPEQVSRRIGAMGDNTVAEQRSLAIVFIDLQGFTGHSERAAPTDVAGWLAGFRDRVNALVLANEGFVDKFIGDGIMAIFGYECEPGDAARQALRVIDALPETMAAWKTASPATPDFRIAVGAAIGPVFVGVVGSGDRREFTVIGDAVNVASRLETFAKERGALAAINFELADHAGQAERMAATSEQVAVRGRQEPAKVCLIPRSQ